MKLTDLSLEEVNVIMAGLGELPAKMSINLMLKLKEQLDPQVEAEQTNVKEKSE